MAKLTIFKDPGDVVDVVEAVGGLPPVDQSALVAQLTAERDTARDERDAVQAKLDALNAAIDAAQGQA